MRSLVTLIPHGIRPAYTPNSSCEPSTRASLYTGCSLFFGFVIHVSGDRCLLVLLLILLGHKCTIVLSLLAMHIEMWRLCVVAKIECNYTPPMYADIAERRRKQSFSPFLDKAHNSYSWRMCFLFKLSLPLFQNVNKHTKIPVSTRIFYHFHCYAIREQIPVSGDRAGDPVIPVNNA